MERPFYPPPNSPYAYIPGPDTLGIGVDNMALAQPGLAYGGNYYGPRYNVRSDLNPIAPGYVKETQELPAVSLRGNGAYLSGQMALQSLVEFDRAIAERK